MKRLVFIALMLLTLTGLAQTKKTQVISTGYDMATGSVTIPIYMDALYDCYIQVECSGMTYTLADTGGVVRLVVRSTSTENWVDYDLCTVEYLTTATQYFNFQNFKSTAWQYGVKFTKDANLLTGTMKIVLVYTTYMVR